MIKTITKTTTSLKQKGVLSPQSKLFIKLINLNNNEIDNLIDEMLTENPCIEEEYTRNKNKDFGNHLESQITLDIEDKFKSLSKYLEEQLNLLDIKENKKRIIYNLILLLDEIGFIKYSNSEIQTILHKEISIKVTEVEIEEIILYCQEKFDPAGIFSRDLKECLKIQLKLKNSKNLNIKCKIIEESISELANKDNEIICKKNNISREFLKKFVKELSDLNPRPGEQFQEALEINYSSNYEASVYFDKNGQIIVQPNKPSKDFKISSYYKKLIKNKKALSPEVYKFIKTRIDDANLTIKTIEEREEMYLRVIKLIVKIQDDFIKRGEKYLKPLKLQDIAEKIGVHESTISRITSNKYILTPLGIMNLKEFFSNKINNDDQKSTTAIREIINTIIIQEDKKHPLSDQEIKEILAVKGINIARRTIAKYRNVLKIPSSSMRRLKK